MNTFCVRLHRGDDLLCCIEKLARQNHIKAGVMLSAVGCLTEAKVRNAGGRDIDTIPDPCEIVSLMGTVSEERCHLHISLSLEDLYTVGGHLVNGCIVNTTCELVVASLDGWEFTAEDDPATGYDEIVMKHSDFELAGDRNMCHNI